MNDTVFSLEKVIPHMDLLAKIFNEAVLKHV